MYKENATRAIAKKRYSFKKGYLQISLSQKQCLKSELMNVLQIKTRQYFSTKLNAGIPDISLSLYETITEIFHKYDITDIWDIYEA